MPSGTKYPKARRDATPRARLRHLIPCPVVSCANACFFLVPSAEADKASTASPLPPLPHYVGCIRNLVMNQSRVDLLRTGTVRGSVGLKGCPVQ